MTHKHTLWGLSNDGLKQVIKAAQYLGDRHLQNEAEKVLFRRNLPSPTVVHQVPEHFHWLPRVFWHTKPVGEGLQPSGGVVEGRPWIGVVILVAVLFWVVACLVFVAWQTYGMGG